MTGNGKKGGKKKKGDGAGEVNISWLKLLNNWAPKPALNE
jgi:hypothetical protein